MVLIAGDEVCGPGNAFVLKRIMIAKGHRAHLSGLREAYFGQLLRGQPLAASQHVEDGQDHIVRFVEAFEVCLPAAHAHHSVNRLYPLDECRTPNKPLTSQHIAFKTDIKVVLLCRQTPVCGSYFVMRESPCTP